MPPEHHHVHRLASLLFQQAGGIFGAVGNGGGTMITPRWYGVAAPGLSISDHKVSSPPAPFCFSGSRPQRGRFPPIGPPSDCCVVRVCVRVCVCISLKLLCAAGLRALLADPRQARPVRPLLRDRGLGELPRVHQGFRGAPAPAHCGRTLWVYIVSAYYERIL